MLKGKDARCFVLGVVVMLLTGCGTTFKNINTACVEKDSHLSASQRIGVMVVWSSIYNSTKISERQLGSALRDSGLNAHTVLPSSAVNDFRTSYGLLDRSTAEGIKSPCTETVGNLGKIFEDEGIDILMVYDGTFEKEATVWGVLIDTSILAAQWKVATATKTPGAVGGAGGPTTTYRAITANHISIITSDGKISRYVSAALPREGGPLYESERTEIAKQLAEIIIGNGQMKEAGITVK